MKKVHHYELRGGVLSSSSLERLRERVQVRVRSASVFYPRRTYEYHGYIVDAVMRDGTVIPVRVVDIDPITQYVEFRRMAATRSE